MVMPCVWEGNRRSGIALVMRHRLSGLSTKGAYGQRKGDEHPAYTPHGVRYILPLGITNLLVIHVRTDA